MSQVKNGNQQQAMDDLTNRVIASIANTKDARLKQVMSALVRKAHEFMREVDLRPEEWIAALQFLKATGDISDDKRQEFILLSDTLGISMMTVMLDQARKAAITTEKPATQATVMGPFYWEGAPELPLGADITQGISGEPTLYRGKVLDTSGKPLAGALLDIWSGDGDGFYDMQKPDAPMGGRARIRTDAQGNYWYWSIRPFYYPIPMDGSVGDMIRNMGRDENRPGHIHMHVRAAGHVPVTTHLFVDNSPYLDTDVVFGVRDGLIVNYQECKAGKAPDGRVLDSRYFIAEYDYYLYPEATVLG